MKIIYANWLARYYLSRCLINDSDIIYDNTEYNLKKKINEDVSIVHELFSNKVQDKCNRMLSL